MIEAAVVFVLLAGEVIATTGTVPRLTVITAGVPAPKALEQATVMVLLPVLSAALLVDGLVEFVPLTVQVVPAGNDVPPVPLTV